MLGRQGGSGGTINGARKRGSIMNCRAWVIGQYKPFIVVEPNSNVLWVTCSTSHKHESCTLRFHIRTSTAVRCLWDAFLLPTLKIQQCIVYIVIRPYNTTSKLPKHNSLVLLCRSDGRNKIFFSNQTPKKGVDDTISCSTTNTRRWRPESAAFVVLQWT